MASRVKRKAKPLNPHTTLRILGRDFGVYIVPYEDMAKYGLEDSCGGVQFHTRRIFLVPSVDLKQTLLHEICEVLNFELELRLSHPRIKALENALYAVLSDNRLVFHE